jgi:NADH dehydrogenase [ubiquinone] 1 alpha subcomplex assembly factor 2
MSALAQWHQWLRHTREDPPSIFEQQMDVQRQLRLKDLARLADERWASKPSILDGPTAGTQSRPASLLRDAGLVAEAQTDVVENLGAGSEESGLLEGGQKSETRTRGNPWNVRTEGPGEQWQPQAWNPPAAVRR